MIFIKTTADKWTKGKTLLRAHGGKIIETTAMSGRLTLKMVMQEIVVDYEYKDGEATFRIVKLPFFFTDGQVRDYLRKILQ